jgi:hypothetical protein
MRRQGHEHRRGIAGGNHVHREHDALPLQPLDRWAPFTPSPPDRPCHPADVRLRTYSALSMNGAIMTTRRRGLPWPRFSRRGERADPRTHVITNIVEVVGDCSR